jgi:biotin operon repressor
MRAMFLAFSALLALSSTAEAAPDWNAVGQALGKNGSEMPGGVYRIGMPRTDLKVMLGDIPLKPTFALGSWVAFREMSGHAEVMGDLVLTEAEVNPVMKSLLDSGFEVTALHNHVFNARPATFYMHVGAMGDPVALAKSLRTALSLSGTPLGNAAAIDAALGAKGTNAGGVYQVGVPRAEPIIEMGQAIPNAMGVTEAINFQPLGGGRAAITGDFILVAKEVNPVIRALKKNGIDVTALHNHMLTEEPRMFFVHFWAADNLPRLLTGLKAAMAEVAVKR